MKKLFFALALCLVSCNEPQTELTELEQELKIWQDLETSNEQVLQVFRERDSISLCVYIINTIDVFQQKQEEIKELIKLEKEENANS